MNHYNFGMKHSWWKLVAVPLAFVAAYSWSTRQRQTLAAQTTGVGVWPERIEGAARLHTGWVIDPVGVSHVTSDLPMSSVLTPDGKFAIFSTMGSKTHQLLAYSLESGAEWKPKFESTGTFMWRGLTWGQGSNSGLLFASGGNKGLIWQTQFDPNSGFLNRKSVAIKGFAERHFVGSLCSLKNGNLLVVDEGLPAAISDQDQIKEVNPLTGEVVRSLSLTNDLMCLTVNPSQTQALTADYGTGQVFLIDLSSFTAKPVLSPEALRGLQANALPQPTEVLFRDDREAFVCLSGADRILKIDTQSGKIIQNYTVNLSSTDPVGAVPNAMAFSADKEKLYVTNANTNCLAVIDLDDEAPAVEGFIPTGRFPVSVLCVPQTGELLVGVGKGFNSLPNASKDRITAAGEPGKLVNQAYGLNKDRKVDSDYIMAQLVGGVTRVPTPTSKLIQTWTQQTLKNSPYRNTYVNKAPGKPANSVLPDSHQSKSPFEHVVFIIKENRTYDQVFGDLKKGRGEPDLVLYGRDITPNHHRLAEEFVILDNLYSNGEVSQDGWEWVTAANDSDWNMKAYHYSYSGKGNPPGAREAIRPSNDYLWEAAARKGLSYISYGAKTFRTLFSPTWKGNVSKEFDEARAAGKRDFEKVDHFIDDLKKAEQTGKWQNLILMSLPDDHTAGTRPGSPTPYASVASNDLALGKVVDAITHSKFWNKTAIFVIEDDAQNGPDHIDAHRTIGLIISPYTARGSLDSTMYTSTSMVRSIGLALGIPPLSQHDAGAAPMYRCFDSKLNLAPYQYVVPKVDLDAKNPAVSKNSKLSASLDFSDVDLADFEILNHILWEDAKPGIPYPTTQHRFRLK